jgi:hypothetical protein
LFAFLRILLLDPAMRNDDQYYFVTYRVVELLCITVSVFLAAKVLDDSDIESLGIKLGRGAVKDFLVGFGMMLLFFGAEFLFFVGLGGVRIHGLAWNTQPLATVLWSNLGTLIAFVFVGWSEELAYRGFQLRIVSKGLNRPLGVILSSAMFTYMHRDNPGFTAVDTIWLFVMGVTFALAFLRSGNLWLAIGLHAGWDFFATELWGGSAWGLRLAHLVDVQLVGYAAVLQFATLFIRLFLISVVVRIYTRHRSVPALNW